MRREEEGRAEHRGDRRRGDNVTALLDETAPPAAAAEGPAREAPRPEMEAGEGRIAAMVRSETPAHKIALSVLGLKKRRQRLLFLAVRPILDKRIANRHVSDNR